ncbi:hypothetical protein DVH05_015835 [Phytophthora capsici]|nr:hypothetical protein DVH05_014204 [Phytophthora capsici]KAG1697881.1 hypothetical protein DVH05_015835 [Phytophthora capsici]
MWPETLEKKRKPCGCSLVLDAMLLEVIAFIEERHVALSMSFRLGHLCAGNDRGSGAAKPGKKSLQRSYRTVGATQASTSVV